MFYLLAFVALIYPSCRENPISTNQCDKCNIDVIFNDVMQSEKGSIGGSLSLDLVNNARATVKRVVEEELKVGGGVELTASKVTETYRRVLPADADITQQANLYREVACSFEKFYCGSNVLNDTLKHERIEQVLNEFRANIYGLLQDKRNSKSPSKTQDEPVRAKQTGSNTVNQSPQNESVSSHIKATNYSISDQPHDVAILSKGQHADMLAGALRMELNRKGYMAGRNYFTSAFLSAFSNDVWNGNAAALSRIGLTPKLNCICSIYSSLESRVNTIQGRNYIEVTGSTNIQLITLQSAESFEYSIRKSGSGPESDPNAALEDYVRKMWNSEEFAKIPFSLCK